MPRKLSELFDEYIEECTLIKRLRPETVRGYAAVFKVFCDLVPDAVYSHDLSRNVFVQFFKELHVRIRIVGRDTEVTGIRVSTAKTYWSKLNCFLEWLRARGCLEHNPLSTIDVPEPKYTDKRALSRSDIEKLLTAITMHSANPLILKRDILIIYILAFCGLRKGELVGLELRDIDLNRRLLCVRGEYSKSRRNRHVPMHSQLCLHLKEYLEARDELNYQTPKLIVSNNSDRGLSRDGLKHWVVRMKRVSGVNFHLHRFRHTFACSLARKGSTSIAIQRLMGHSDLRMTEKYLRSLGVDDVRVDIDRLGLDAF